MSRILPGNRWFPSRAFRRIARTWPLRPAAFIRIHLHSVTGVAAGPPAGAWALPSQLATPLKSQVWQLQLYIWGSKPQSLLGALAAGKVAHLEGVLTVIDVPAAQHHAKAQARPMTVCEREDASRMSRALFLAHSEVCTSQLCVKARFELSHWRP